MRGWKREPRSPKRPTHTKPLPNSGLPMMDIGAASLLAMGIDAAWWFTPPAPPAQLGPLPEAGAPWPDPYVGPGRADAPERGRGQAA